MPETHGGTETVTDVPNVTFLPQEGRPREERVALDWPFTLDGRNVAEVIVRRMTTAQVEAFIEQAKARPDAVPPMLFFADGEPVPEAVVAAIDDDDDAKLYEAMTRFLPRRLRPASAPTPASGGGTAS